MRALIVIILAVIYELIYSLLGNHLYFSQKTFTQSCFQGKHSNQNVLFQTLSKAFWKWNKEGLLELQGIGSCSLCVILLRSEPGDPNADADQGVKRKEAFISMQGSLPGDPESSQNQIVRHRDIQKQSSTECKKKRRRLAQILFFPSVSSWHAWRERLTCTSLPQIQYTLRVLEWMERTTFKI